MAGTELAKVPTTRGEQYVKKYYFMFSESISKIQDMYHKIQVVKF